MLHFCFRFIVRAIKYCCFAQAWRGVGEWRPRKGRFPWRCMVFGPLISTLASTDCQWHGFEIWPLCKHTWFLSNTGGRCQHLLLFSARSCSHRLCDRNLRRVPITGQFLQWFIHELVYSLHYNGFESDSSFKSIHNNLCFQFLKVWASLLLSKFESTMG